MNKKLYRDKQNSTIGGVCAGLAEYFSVDVTLVRALFLVAMIGFGTGFLLYLILWAVVPEKPYSAYTQQETDYRVHTEDTGTPTSTTYKHKNDQSNLMAGIVMVILGLIFLADQFVSWVSFSKLWPLILIAVGAVLLISHSKKSK